MFCRLLKRENGFAIVPNETDFYLTMQAIEEHGPANIAALINVVSALYYTPNELETLQED